MPNTATRDAASFSIAARPKRSSVREKQLSMGILLFESL
jgi:hypothetical protein